MIQHTFETIGDNHQHMIDLTDFEADEDLHPEPGTFASFYLHSQNARKPSGMKPCSGQIALLRTTVTCTEISYRRYLKSPTSVSNSLSIVFTNSFGVQHFRVKCGLIALQCCRQSSTMNRVLQLLLNHSIDKHSSRNFPSKILVTPFCHGLPGSIGYRFQLCSTDIEDDILARLSSAFVRYLWPWSTALIQILKQRSLPSSIPSHGRKTRIRP